MQVIRIKLRPTLKISAMNILEKHFARWKEQGYRMTKNRAALLEIFLTEEHPLSAEEVLKKLKRKRLTINTSTLYRELEFLEKESVIQEVKLQGKKRLFELSFKKHHHHLYCLTCESIEEVEMDNELEALERSIQRRKKFKIQSHALEFFGLCVRCSA